MLDGVTLDQFRTFIAAVDEGSFSAAGRRLGRAQSVVSQTLANMEGQLGIQLFDRSGRIPVLTESGRALLATFALMTTIALPLMFVAPTDPPAGDDRATVKVDGGCSELLTLLSEELAAASVR